MKTAKEFRTRFGIQSEKTSADDPGIAEVLIVVLQLELIGCIVKNSGQVLRIVLHAQEPTFQTMAVTVFPPVQVGVEVGIYALGDSNRGVKSDISFAARIPEQGFSVLTPKDPAVHAELELLIGAKAIRPIDPCLFVGFTEFEPFVLLSITTQYPFMLLAFEGVQPLDACIGTPAVPPLELRPWRISVHRVEHIDFGQRHGFGPDGPELHNTIQCRGTKEGRGCALQDLHLFDGFDGHQVPLYLTCIGRDQRHVVQKDLYTRSGPVGPAASVPDVQLAIGDVHSGDHGQNIPAVRGVASLDDPGFHDR